MKQPVANDAQLEAIMANINDLLPDACAVVMLYDSKTGVMTWTSNMELNQTIDLVGHSLECIKNPVALDDPQ